MFPSCKKDNSSLQTSSSKETVMLMEQLASRICHDLISPIGAIHNGLEFLEDMGADALEDALGLMVHSTKQATVKLKAFRMAYGAGGRDPMVKLQDVHDIMGEYIDLEGKITQNWAPHETFSFDDMPDAFCKILVGGLLFMCEVLPKGGALTVENDGDVTTITAEGEGANLRENMQEAFDNELDVATLDPRLVSAYLIGLSVKSFDYTATLSQEGSKVILSFQN